MRLFGGSDARDDAAKESARIPRVSSGWKQMLTLMEREEGLRTLDFGPTSSTNINLLTGMGHSIYMANLVAEAADPKWAPKEPDGEFPAEAFLKENLDFGGRQFDSVLFWDTADYLPAGLRAAVIGRLHQVMQPGGHLLAFFHIKPDASGYHRYHLRTDGGVESQWSSPHSISETLNNRQIEDLFRDFANFRFFLAKDNLREVLVTR